MSAADSSQLSFEQAMDRLQEIVDAMESDRTPLEEMVTSYEEGMKLLKLCRRHIDQARQRVELIQMKSGTEAELAEFDPAQQQATSAGEERSRPSSSAASARRRPPAARSENGGESDEIRLF